MITSTLPRRAKAVDMKTLLLAEKVLIRGPGSEPQFARILGRSEERQPEGDSRRTRFAVELFEVKEGPNYVMEENGGLVLELSETNRCEGFSYFATAIIGRQLTRGTTEIDCTTNGIPVKIFNETITVNMVGPYIVDSRPEGVDAEILRGDNTALGTLHWAASALRHSEFEKLEERDARQLVLFHGQAFEFSIKKICARLKVLETIAFAAEKAMQLQSPNV